MVQIFCWIEKKCIISQPVKNHYEVVYNFIYSEQTHESAAICHKTCLMYFEMSNSTAVFSY